MAIRRIVSGIVECEPHYKVGLWQTNEYGCWSVCGSKGGKCEFCGENGYCCTVDQSKQEQNGDCPAGALNELSYLSGTGHRCVNFVEGKSADIHVVP